MSPSFVRRRGRKEREMKNKLILALLILIPGFLLLILLVAIYDASKSHIP